MSKSAWLLICMLSCFILEALLQLNVYVLLMIQTVLFAFVWYLEDQKNKLEIKREQQELQIKVQSTTKDAHLKFKQLMTMVSSIPSPLLLLDQFGNIVLHNEVVKITHHQYDGEETYLHNGYTPVVQEFIKDAFILEKQLERRLDIHQIEFQAMSVPVFSHDKFSGCLILFQDISKALEGEKMQKRFLADASHELKTPIAVIKGMVEILNRADFHDPETQVDFLHQIEQEINRLDLLVKDILTLSKMSSDHPLLDRHKVDMKELIDTALASLTKSAEEKGLQLSADVKIKEPVFCDPMKMRQVITNLIQNAIKYTEEGTISVACEQKDSEIMIEVRDTGCGLTAQEQGRIFDRFYRVKDDRSRKSGGSGLGLAIVKSIVEAHHGHIEVESAAGEGSTFRVYLRN